MKKLTKLAMLSSALISAQVMAVPAMAQKAEPSGTHSGLVDVNKGIALKCTLELEVDPVTDTATVTYFGPPAALACSSSTFDNQPYSYTFDPVSGDFTLTGVFVNTITAGDCSGSITANWTDDAILVDSFLPADSAGADCTISGILDFVP